MSSTPLYTSTLSIPYAPHSPLNTLDLHHLSPTSPLLSPSYHLIYIHGGAFRDPLVTSTSISPSLPALFSTQHISTIASLNYRLSPYPDHPTHPSSSSSSSSLRSQDDEGRNVKWPVHIEDVREAVGWLKREGGMAEGKEWIVCGHSVGGTMALMLGMEPKLSEWDHGWGHEMPMADLRGVVGVEGIYDFKACRDAHAGMRELYEGFLEGAFGREEEGGWKRGDVVRCGRKVGDGVGVVVVGQSREDELVEWEQAVGMMGALEWEGGGGKKVLVEVEGRHQEVVTGGVGIGKCVARCVELLVGLE